MKGSLLPVITVGGIFLLGMTGCGTIQSLRNVDAAIARQLDEVREGMQMNRTEIASLKKSDARQDNQMRQYANTIQAAVARAQEAGKVAAGRLLWEATLSDESVHFAFDESDLTDEAKVSLDIFAGLIKEQNKNIYVEIQGHTDNVGTEEDNLKLGQARAEAVMRYLYIQHSIPLHRMNAFSYGESKPVADNSIPSNRAKNRRVRLVVME